jgi:hypothetical protein
MMKSAMKKKIQLIGSSLLAALVIFSSFGYTMVVHSCSVSGSHTIYINKTDTSKACTDCCSDTKAASKSITQEDCCKDQTFSHVLLIEASNSELKTTTKSITIPSFTPLHFLPNLPLYQFDNFAHELPNDGVLALSKPSSLAYLQNACKLQI